jgi:hypothetical protein
LKRSPSFASLGAQGRRSRGLTYGADFSSLKKGEERERDGVDLRTEKQRWVKWLVGFVYVFIDGGERDLSKLESLVCNGGNQREKQ